MMVDPGNKFRRSELPSGRGGPTSDSGAVEAELLPHLLSAEAHSPSARKNARCRQLPTGRESHKTHARIGVGGAVMLNSEFEPFGESLARVERGHLGPADRTSAILLRSGTGLFWALVVCVVIARAFFV